MKNHKKQKVASDDGEGSHHSLFRAISVIRDPEEAARFFEDLCTPGELQAMTDRWRVVGYVKAGSSYREISQKTGVSVTTIGRVARHMTYGQDGYDIIYNRLNAEDDAIQKKTQSGHSEKGEIE